MKLKCYVAKNKNEWDVENMSFFRTKKRAVKYFGTRQEILKVILIIEPATPEREG